MNISTAIKEVSKNIHDFKISILSGNINSFKIKPLKENPEGVLEDREI